VSALWRMPALLAAMILAGLLDALLIDNSVSRVIAWALLAAPIIVAGIVALRGRITSADR
jgi:hypothetical protein